MSSKLIFVHQELTRAPREESRCVRSPRAGQRRAGWSCFSPSILWIPRGGNSSGRQAWLMASTLTQRALWPALPFSFSMEACHVMLIFSLSCTPFSPRVFQVLKWQRYPLHLPPPRRPVSLKNPTREISHCLPTFRTPFLLCFLVSLRQFPHPFKYSELPERQPFNPPTQRCAVTMVRAIYNPHILIQFAPPS